MANDLTPVPDRESAVLALGFQQMNKPVLHLGQRKPFALQAQAFDLFVEHVDPSAGKRRVAVHSFAHFADRYLDDLRVSDYVPVTVVQCLRTGRLRTSGYFRPYEIKEWAQNR